jgi:hypothetical protein
VQFRTSTALAVARSDWEVGFLFWGEEEVPRLELEMWRSFTSGVGVYRLACSSLLVLLLVPLLLALWISLDLLETTVCSLQCALIDLG